MVVNEANEGYLRFALVDKAMFGTSKDKIGKRSDIVG